MIASPTFTPRKLLGRLDAALQDLDEAVRLAPERALVRFHRAEVRAARGDAAGALDDFDAGLALEPVSALS